MSDLETRLIGVLTSRADEAGTWGGSGAELRGLGRQRTSRRRRAGAVLVGAAAVVVAGVAGIAALPGERADRHARPVGSPSPPVYVPQLVDVPADLVTQARVVTFSPSTASVVLGTRLPRSGAYAVVLAADGHPGYVVSTASVVDGVVQRSVDALYPTLATVLAQPVRDGSGTDLLVYAPLAMRGTRVEVTSALPGALGIPAVVAGVMRDGLAVVPVAGPESATRLRIFAGGVVAYDDIPGGALLGPSVPRTVDEVMVASGTSPIDVQVRSDGSFACRFTVSGYWPADSKANAWNPFDAACAPVSQELTLLLAPDRVYSTVAGIAPVGTAVVRLTWRNGPPTTERVSSGDVPSFVDTSGLHSAADLVSAEAFTADARLMASATPVPVRP